MCVFRDRRVYFTISSQARRTDYFYTYRARRFRSLPVAVNQWEVLELWDSSVKETSAGPRDQKNTPNKERVKYKEEIGDRIKTDHRNAGLCLSFCICVQDNGNMLIEPVSNPSRWQVSARCTLQAYSLFFFPLLSSVQSVCLHAERVSKVMGRR